MAAVTAPARRWSHLTARRSALQAISRGTVFDHRNGGRMATTEPGLARTDVSLDELGPVDYIVVEFPAGKSNFTGEMANELLALVDSGTIRVMDVLILRKTENGTVDAMELSDIEELGELQAVEAQLAELLAADDVENLA